MKPKEIAFNIKGMKPDLDISKSESDFSFKNTNIQITQSSTNNSLVADVGLTYDSIESEIKGDTIGIVYYNGRAVLFTKENNVDRIYLVKGKYNKLQYEGDLNFSKDGEFEGVYYKEGDGLEKIYWVDGINPLRVINVDWNKDYLNKDNTVFDINYKLSYKEELNINKRFADGSFHSGVVQYFFTYFDKFGKESSIFKSSSIYYSTPTNNRAGSPEETCTNVFDIELRNLQYENVRIYSLHRTSKDVNTVAYIVADLEVKNNKISYTDNNRGVISISPDVLLYLGAEFFIPKTITVKDNTMFLGNYSVRKIDSSDINLTQKRHSSLSLSVDRAKQLSSSQRDITFLKHNEYYKVVIQWLNSWGKPVGYSNTYTLKATDKPVVVNNTIQAPIYSISFNPIKDPTVAGARVLIHYPEGHERRVITQGILNPTVFNVRDRNTNSPYAQASWFFRPENGINNGGLTYAHGYALKILEDKEFQNFYSEIDLFRNHLPDYSKDLSRYFLLDTNKMGSAFAVDRNILTLNTPELESIIENSNAKAINLVGLCKIKEGYNGYESLINNILEARPIADSYNPDFPYFNSLYPISIKDDTYILSTPFGRVGNINGDNNNTDKDTIKLRKFYSYRRGYTSYDIDISGTLRDIIKVETSDEKLYKIDGKFYKGSIDTIITNAPKDNPIVKAEKDVYTFFKNIKDKKTENVGTKKEGNNGRGIPLTYKSTGHLVLSIDNINDQPILGYAGEAPSKLEAPSSNYAEDDFVYIEEEVDDYIEAPGDWTGHDGFEVPTKRIEKVPKYGYGEKYFNEEAKDFVTNFVKKDSTPIKIIDGETETSYTDSTLIPIDTFNVTSRDDMEKYLELYINTLFKEHKFKKATIENNTVNVTGLGSKVYSTKISNYNGISHLYVITPKDTLTIDYKELFRFIRNKSRGKNITYRPFEHISYNIKKDNNKESILFIADILNSEEPIYNEDLSWTVASDVVLLEGKDSIEIPIYGGDTYFQIYDCLKTIPYKDTDVNQVTEALSVALETRTNIYGRYDKNLDTYDYKNITENNFNKVNPVYSQSNNFFTFRKIDDWKLRDNFPNQITWSKGKSNGEPIDSFTHYSLANTLDLDGSYGNLTKLLTFKDNIFFIQDNGFGNVLFNSRVQIPVSDGVPIEITNGYKVEGYRYISDSIGSSIKGSIVKSLDYLYFYSSTLKELYQFGQGLNPLGISNNMSSLSIPFFDRGNDIYSTYAIDHRVLFYSNQEQLVYNELLGTFESFYTYPINRFFYSDNSNIYSYGRNIITIPNALNSNRFDNILPWEIVYKVNPQQKASDNIFTNAEFVFGENTPDRELIPFNYLEIFNNYQSGIIDRINDMYKLPYTMKKFRFYRTALPRDKKNRIDRIRGPWAKVRIGGLCNKLSNNLIKSFTIKYFE